MKTLIVDDEFTSSLLLQQRLKPYGECHIAVNGREAVDAFRKALDEGTPYDLICMDIMMPEMDGQAALKEIRRMEEARGIISIHGVKVIMATSMDAPQNILDAFKSLCDGYIIKPVDKTKLLDYIRTFGLIP
jgi:two-component system, chemotaxis family, chemotaxis protein CheY